MKRGGIKPMIQFAMAFPDSLETFGNLEANCTNSMLGITITIFQFSEEA